jgi:GNAT superfamily N-acetyltransferase
MHGLEFQRRIEEAGDVLWIAVWRGKVMGHTWVSKMWSFEGIVSWFSGGTWVHPFFRGIGVGRRLIEGSLGDACGSGKKQIYGNISADNSFSLAMCERAGFRRISKPQWSRIIQDSYRRRTGTAKAQVIVVYDCDRTDGDRS